MREPHITVTSTALNCERYAARCVESVIRQTFERWEHHYFDAGSDDDTTNSALRAAVKRGHWRPDTLHASPDSDSVDRRFVSHYSGHRPEALEQLVPFWRSLPEDEIVVWLDGDDWLAHDHALEIVTDAYRNKTTLCTWGQFMNTRGEVGFARAYDWYSDDPRTGPWLATHLKTFRAGLIRLLPDEYLKGVDGRWMHYAIDQAVMIPILEMCGVRGAQDRSHLARFIPNILAVYNLDHAWHVTEAKDDAEVERDQAAVRWIRGHKPMREIRSQDLRRCCGMGEA